MLECLLAPRRGPVSSVGVLAAPGTPISLLTVVILTRHRLFTGSSRRGKTERRVNQRHLALCELEDRSQLRLPHPTGCKRGPPPTARNQSVGMSLSQ